ncbi:MAG: tRNA uridine-5-carboxymethylaminomethyl(34) synthesis GTPase MnmE [Sphingobium sp.]|uniref:tRNA uridine-5-carboxymethylaminomethyl(34) synthesis GTPase MnmE n=1 Tax=Sphingobium sp. TaxID=1912891 RepID=UPI0029B7B33F|nr:tRNA uridine-5-carboxymethylaminomethyl(34) synthesis GTPase MnmE [Sphingobium sp.]MDX3909232.1 tRNA uridine-5-carboxymethylaminomethyl(34) synthesis GTPase MnmE [Sphingobium sp.]
METIFALSSGQPPSAIGVIRISGPEAATVLRALTGRLPSPRRATLASIRDPSDGVVLDEALTIWFPGPRTATGEDLAEIHCHGGRAVTAAVLRVLGAQRGCRLAVAGEFTRRAFENGRIDLNEAEGLADLLFAETETQRRAAMAMAQGKFSQLLAKWETELLNLSARVEAVLDFSDEDDVAAEAEESAFLGDIAALGERVTAELERPSAERLRNGVRVVIAGPPNAGKSTLLNALVGREAAIVSSIAGTTRDRIEVPVSIGGTAFLITDTAGLRDTEDVVEATGVTRAQEAIEHADVLIWLGRPGEAPRFDAINIVPKADVDGWAMRPGGHLGVSAVTGQGMDLLVSTLLEVANTMLPREGEYALHARQHAALRNLADGLQEARGERDLIIVAEHLRRARLVIDRLTGRSGTEHMLDALFGTFCIGK